MDLTGVGEGSAEGGAPVRLGGQGRFTDAGRYPLVDRGHESSRLGELLLRSGWAYRLGQETCAGWRVRSIAGETQLPGTQDVDKMVSTDPSCNTDQGV